LVSSFLAFLGVAFFGFAAAFFGAAFFAAGALVLVTRPDLVLPSATEGFSATAGALAVEVFLLVLAFGLAAFLAAGLAFFSAVFFGLAAVFCSII
jgi:hypothetical protein